MRGTWIAGMACALAACSGAGDAAPAARADSTSAAQGAPAAVEATRSGGAGDTVRIHPTLPPYGFALHPGAEPGVVDSIVVTSAGRRVQTLVPGENLVPPDAGVERLSTIDLDYDGYADLALLGMLAMANSRSQYWRFDPRTRSFADIGEFDTLTPDSAARELTSVNRGGHGGRMWTAARWRWAENRLVPFAEEEQSALDEVGGRYVHIVRRLQDGRMVEVRRDTLEGDAELRAGPTWMEQ